MEWKWLIKVYLVVTAAVMLALSLVSLGPIGPGIIGVLFLLGAFYYDRLEGILDPPCLARFDPRIRRRVEGRNRTAARLILAFWGIYWVAGASRWRPFPLHLIAWEPVLLWLFGGLAFLTIIELVRSRVAARADTYEEYFLKFTAYARWISLVLVAVVIFAFLRWTG